MRLAQPGKNGANRVERVVLNELVKTSRVRWADEEFIPFTLFYEYFGWQSRA